MVKNQSDVLDRYGHGMVTPCPLCSIRWFSKDFLIFPLVRFEVSNPTSGCTYKCLLPITHIEAQRCFQRFFQSSQSPFLEVNRRIVQGKNKYVTIHKDGHFSLHTPAVTKPDYDSITTIIGKDKYIPILQMMAEINAVTKFTTYFKHHKITGSKPAPEKFKRECNLLHTSSDGKKQCVSAESLNTNHSYLTTI